MQKNSANQLVQKFKVKIGVEIDNYQWNLFLLNIFKIQLIQVAMKKPEFHSYISDDNEQDACYSHAHMFHLLQNIFELLILVSGMSTVWEDTNNCAKQQMCCLAIYLIYFHMVL